MDSYFKMNLQFQFEKLKSSEEFKKFIKENPSAFLCSGFFVIDKQGEDNQIHFDYFAEGKILSFQMEDNCKLVQLENVGGKIPEEIPEEINFEVDEIEKLISDKLNAENVKNKIQKILLSLQNLDGKYFLLGTVFISGWGIIKININLNEMKVTEFEKKSFFDMVNVFRKK